MQCIASLPGKRRPTGLRSIFLILIAAFISTLASAQKFQTLRVDTVANAGELERLIYSSRDTLHIYLLPGDYHLKPRQGIDSALYDSAAVFSDSTKLSLYARLTAPDSTGVIDAIKTGRVFDSLASVPISYGLRIQKSVVHIKGAPAFASALYTHAGYGLFFVNCRDAWLDGVIITGGVRDADPRATDAGIVSVNSKLRLSNNLIFGNEGDSAMLRKTKVGIMGICVREGSNAIVFNNQVARNSWDGIGVYKNASATITGNLIDGVDKAKENEPGGGRGVGIMVTRNGKATIETNLIKRYNKGIGIYVNANVQVSNNLIEDIAIWGINVWDADTGKPVARIERNVIYKTGACGIAIIRYREGGGDPGFCRDNIVVESGQNRDFDIPNKYCYQCALAVHGRPDAFAIENNVFYKNTWIAPCFTNLDTPLADFIDILQSRYSALPLQWYAGYSEFVQRFYFYVEKE
jgi:hypothetical protein